MILGENIDTGGFYTLRKPSVAHRRIPANLPLTMETESRNLELKTQETPLTQQATRHKLHACRVRVINDVWVCR